MNQSIVVDFLEAQLGAVTGLEAFPGEHAHSQVIRAATEEGYAFLKLHRGRKSYLQELDFYQNFAEKLERVPQLLGTLEEEFALLLSALPGVPCRSLLLADRGNFHLLAGRFLKQLHALPTEDQDIPLDQALQKRLNSFESRALKAFPEAEIRNCVQALRELLQEERPLSRVPCHRDFMEHNWLCVGQEQLHVVDFEHFKTDYFLLDLCQLKARAWASEPGLSKAFFQGYGRELDSWEERFLQHWSLLWSYSTVMWSREHQDKRYERLGLRAIQFLKSPP